MNFVFFLRSSALHFIFYVSASPHLNIYLFLLKTGVKGMSNIEVVSINFRHWFITIDTRARISREGSFTMPHSVRDGSRVRSLRNTRIQFLTGGVVKNPLSSSFFYKSTQQSDSYNLYQPLNFPLHRPLSHSHLPEICESLPYQNAHTTLNNHFTTSTRAENLIALKIPALE